MTERNMGQVRAHVEQARELVESLRGALCGISKEALLAACGHSEPVARRLRFDLFVDQTPVNTKSLLEAISWAASPFEELHELGDFGNWCERYRAAEVQVAHRLPERFASHLPLREAVLPLVALELTGKMPFSKDYVMQHYERSLHDKSYLTYPARDAKRLLVFFSGNVGRKTYNRFSWYWDETEQWHTDTACLFLNDINSHWYVGRSGQADRAAYGNIITTVMGEFGVKPQQVILVGGSMGGYGALLYAIELGLRGAIAVNPQLGRQSARRYKEPSWEEKIAECGANFRELADEVYRFERAPLIYLEHSAAACDLAGLDEFVTAVRMQNGFAMLRSTGEATHLAANPTKAQVDALVDFMERFQ